MKAICLFLGPLLLGTVSIAAAEPQGNEHDLARNLFEQGVQKARDGKCDTAPVGDVDKCREAIDLFHRAYALDNDALGALRNRAQLEQNLGMVGSAVRDYRELARKAANDPKPARRAWVDSAKSAVTTLQSRVPHLTVSVPSAPPGAEVKIDRDVMPQPAWGAPLEVDPGPHNVIAQAPNFLSFEVRVDLTEGESRTVRVELQPQPSAAQAAAPVATPETTPTPAPAPGPSAPAPVAPAPARSSPGIGPWLVVGAGGLALGVGSVFGISAINQHGTACPNGGKICNQEEYNKGTQMADTSTVLFVVGGAAVGGGLLWYFLADGAHDEGSPRAGKLEPVVGLSSLGLRGHFE